MLRYFFKKIQTPDEKINLKPQEKLEKNPIDDGKDHYLVLGCGKKCAHGKHTSPLWDSIDPEEDQKPTFIGTMEDIIESKKIPYKYNLIYAEAITDSVSLDRLNLMNTLAKDNAVIIVSPSAKNIYLPTMQGFITAFSTTIIFKQISPEIFAETEEVIKKEITSLDGKKQIMQIIGKVNDMLGKNELLVNRSLWIFFLAHVQLYNENRQQRTVRNWFKDHLYQEFQRYLEKVIFDYSKPLDTQKLLETIQDWQVRLPSSTDAAHKLKYDPLNRIINVFKNAIAVPESGIKYQPKQA